MTYVRSFAVVALAGLLASCAWIDPDADPRRQAVADLGFEVATLRFVDGQPERAERVRQATQLVAALVASDEAMTLESLSLAVDSRIDWARYTPTEAALGRAILELVAADLARLTPEGVLDAAARDRLLRVLTVIERGAV